MRYPKSLLVFLHNPWHTLWKINFLQNTLPAIVILSMTWLYPISFSMDCAGSWMILETAGDLPIPKQWITLKDE